MKKRMLSMALALCMLLGMLPATSFAEARGAAVPCGPIDPWEEPIVCGDNGYTIWFWRYSREIDQVDGGSETETELTIPAEIQGFPVSIIKGCAFSSCDYLQTVNIPHSIEDMTYAFDHCQSLVNINVDTDNKYYASVDGVLFDKEKTELIRYPAGRPAASYTIPSGVTSIESWAFQGCSSLTSVTIPNGVKYIGWAAFKDCTGLTSVSLPASVTGLDNRAFEDCALTAINVAADNERYSSVDGVLFNKERTELIRYPAGRPAASYTIPYGVTSIGEWAFEGCSSLTSVTIPDGVTSIGEYAFRSCSSLKNITIPSSVTSIGHSAFSGTAYYNNEANWENGVLYIDSALIEAQEELSGAYNIKNGTTCIANSAFSHCSSLTSVIIPDGVTSIGNSAFYYCSSLTSVIIPDGVTSIGEYAFRSCSSLTSVTIPDGVTSIGNYAFEGCSSLKDVYYAGSQEQWKDIEIGHSNSPLRNATIHYNFSGHDIIPYPVTGGNIYFDKITGKVIGSDENVTAADIPAEIDGIAVTGIADSAFENRYRLGRVAIPEGVTSIGENAFASCGALVRLILPKSVESIGWGAFYSCEGLLAYNSIVYYPGTEDDWAAIDIGNYNGMLINAKNIYYNCSGSINIQLADTASSPLPINVVKMLRWQGMDHSSSSEPRNRGYDPTNISCTLTIYEDAGESYPTPTMQYNDYNAAEVLRRLTEEAEYHKYLYQNGELAEVPLTIESSPLGGFFLKHGDEPQLYVSAQFGMQPHTWHALELVFTSLAPGCIKMTLDGREYAFITPGDVNLDGTMNALDWITIMRWTLVASGGEYTSPDDEGFTINVDDTQYNLWVLLADMTDTETDNSKNSENWGAAVNAVDWTTIMQLTLQAWKGSEQSELSDRFAIVIEKTSEPRYSENGVPIPDGDIRRVNYLNAAGENVTAEYAPPQRGSFVAFEDILIDGVYEYVLNSDGTVYFLEKPNAVKGVTFGGKDARPIISPTQKNYGGMVASDDTWFFVREIVFPDGTWTPRYSVKRMSDFQLRDQSDNQLLTDASYAYTTDSSPLPIRRVLFGTLLLDREIMPGYPGQSGWLLATGSTYERTVGGEVHVMLDGIDESGAQVVLDLGVYENGDCGDYNKFDLIESGKLYAYDMLYATGISELFETPEGLCYQSSYGRSTFWTELSVTAENGGVVQVRLDPENAQYLTPDAIHAPNTYDLHYDSKTVIVNVHTRNGEIVYDSGVDEIGRTAPYDLKVHKADGTYEYSEQEYTNAYALVHTNGYISYIIVDSSYGGSVVGDALELHEGCDCDKADVYAGNIYSNLTGGVQKVTNGWNRR